MFQKNSTKYFKKFFGTFLRESMPVGTRGSAWLLAHRKDYFFLKNVGEELMRDQEREFHKDQIEHLQILQKQILNYCSTLTVSAIEHDTSKWSDCEYEAFCSSRSALRTSKNGQDENYQKHVKSEAIQHHIQFNPHHPEYWDRLGLPMPVHEVIAMFFDWRSRCIARGGKMADFWDYNLAKLKNQPHAKVIVECLRREIIDSPQDEYGHKAQEEDNMFSIIASIREKLR